MTIGIIGLGKMGLAIAARLRNASHDVFGYDPSERVQKEAQDLGVIMVPEVERIAKKCSVIWLMLPAGGLIDDVLSKLVPHLSQSSIIVDGGNSKFTDSIMRAELLLKSGHVFLDCGTSGGVHGLRDGFCLMVGGDRHAFEKIEPFMRAIASPDGYLYVGPSGTGHYVKMVHNGIEYGLMQAYAEGLHIIKDGYFKEVPIDLAVLTQVWNQSSVIRSFLLKLTHDILARDTQLEKISGSVAESGMGKWTLQEAQENDIPAPVLKNALEVRAWSRDTGGNYATKLLAMMRQQFGGHTVGKKE